MRIREQVLRAQPLCPLCKAKGRIELASEVDHIIPLHKGGTDAPANLQGLCAECHAHKTAGDRGAKRRPEIGLDGVPVTGWP